MYTHVCERIQTIVFTSTARGTYILYLYTHENVVVYSRFNNEGGKLCFWK